MPPARIPGPAKISIGGLSNRAGCACIGACHSKLPGLECPPTAWLGSTVSKRPA
jgi:hypothetical protein